MQNRIIGHLMCLTHFKELPGKVTPSYIQGIFHLVREKFLMTENDLEKRIAGK